MTSRKKIVAGNWKMHKDREETVRMIRYLMENQGPAHVLTVLGVPFPFLEIAKREVGKEKNLIIAAQNCHEKMQGAYTGEVSVTMLKSIGISWGIVGHSERREYFNESDISVGEKVKLLLDHQMTPIYCCGEPLNIRRQGSHIEYVRNQIHASLFSLTENEISRIVIAYEPIWAIGTGETATPNQAQEMHFAIRGYIAEKFPSASSNMSILYGGSVKPDNANDLFSQPDVDGGLVGGSSLDEASFLKIIRAF
ncbi:MAG TPA: triose-phosphate isomerase [Saprospiraceae bacterium]|nr:triose-phosphate isomerase [Saprospiraceae bacterium]